ncbi:MAG: PAS domain-containing protein [Alphaproteobacteria bacterium]|nr:PAS domain-containing protein [Alphaproteobacteria bacterium]
MAEQKDFILDLPEFAKHVAILDFLQSWHRWRGDGLLPKRAAIKLSDMPELMRGAMMLDAFAPERMIFRFAGSLYHDMYGFEFEGLNYLDITEPEVRAIRAKRLWGVVSQPAIAVWTAPGAEGVNFVGASVPLLPDDPTHPRKIMQVLVALKDMAGVSKEAWNTRRDNVVFSPHFRYLDIGAGKPDNGAEA